MSEMHFRHYGKAIVALLGGEECAGFGRLRFSFDLQENKQSQSFRFAEVTGDLMLRVPGRNQLPVGRLELTMPLLELGPDRGSSLSQMTCELDRARFEAIERVRPSGAGLGLRLLVRALITQAGKSEAYEASADLEIEQSHWLRVLEAVGYQRTLVIEVPISDVLPAAFGFAEKAQQLLSQGHYEEAVVACRRAVDALRDAIGAGTQGFAVDHAKNKMEWTKADRIKQLGTALFSLCSAAAHGDGNAQKIEWGRGETRELVGQVVLFLKMAARELALK